MTVTPGEPVPQFALIPGPVTGLMTTSDGKTYDVSPAIIVVDSQEHADDLAHQIGLHWEEAGHPDDIEEDEETGELVQRKFVYHTPRQARKILREQGIELPDEDRVLPRHLDRDDDDDED